MKPISFPQQTKVLGAPAGLENEVLPLPVFTDGQQCTSCWELTDEEVEYVVKNKKIFISIFAGQSQPPILPYAENPFTVISQCMVIIGNSTGVTLNGQQIFTDQQLEANAWKDSWGEVNPMSEWLARQIMLKEAMNSTIVMEFIDPFVKMFLLPLKQGEPFTMLIDVRRFLIDYAEGRKLSASAYLFSAQIS